MSWLILSLFLSGPAHAFKAKKASNPELIEALSYDDDNDREDAIAEIERRELTDAGDKLAEIAKTDPVDGLRRKALMVLEDLRYEGLYDVCAHVLENDAASANRQKAMAILEATGPSQYSSAVGYAAQNDEDAATRRKALIIIGKRNWTDQQDAVLAATTDSDVKVQHQAWVALIRLGDEAMRPNVHTALADGDEKTREQIAKVIGEAPLAVDYEPLVKALDDEDVDVKVLAARSLAKLGDTNAGPILREKAGLATEEKVAEEFAKAAAMLGS